MWVTGEGKSVKSFGFRRKDKLRGYKAKRKKVRAPVFVGDRTVTNASRLVVAPMLADERDQTCFGRASGSPTAHETHPIPFRPRDRRKSARLHCRERTDQLARPPDFRAWPPSLAGCTLRAEGRFPMTHDCRSSPVRTGSLPSVVIAIGAILCVGTLCRSQPSPQNVIKCKLIIAEELSLDLSGTKLAARLSKSASGLASLAFFDSNNSRSVGVTVQGNGDPTVFMTTANPRTLTSLELSSKGSASLRLGEETESEQLSLPPGIRLLDSAVIMFIGENGETRVSLDAEPTEKVRSNVELIDSNGKPGIRLLDSSNQSSRISLYDRKHILKSGVVVEPPGARAFFSAIRRVFFVSFWISMPEETRESGYATASQRPCARLFTIRPFPPQVWCFYVFQAAPAGVGVRSGG